VSEVDGNSAGAVEGLDDFGGMDTRTTGDGVRHPEAATSAAAINPNRYRLTTARPIGAPVRSESGTFTRLLIGWQNGATESVSPIASEYEENEAVAKSGNRFGETRSCNAG
jgi:hypothetical protein